MATEIRPYSSLSSKSSYRSSEPTEFFPPADEPVEFSPPPDEPVDSSPSDHYVSYVKEITKNEVESVIITHINSPSDFYLQLQANVSIMKLIENKLNKFVLNTLSAVDHIEMSESSILFVGAFLFVVTLKTTSYLFSDSFSNF